MNTLGETSVVTKSGKCFKMPNIPGVLPDVFDVVVQRPLVRMNISQSVHLSSVEKYYGCPPRPWEKDWKLSVVCTRDSGVYCLLCFPLAEPVPIGFFSNLKQSVLYFYLYVSNLGNYCKGHISHVSFLQ